MKNKRKKITPTSKSIYQIFSLFSPLFSHTAKSCRHRPLIPCTIILLVLSCFTSDRQVCRENDTCRRPRYILLHVNKDCSLQLASLNTTLELAQIKLVPCINDKHCLLPRRGLSLFNCSNKNTFNNDNCRDAQQ